MKQSLFTTTILGGLFLVLILGVLVAVRNVKPSKTLESSPIDQNLQLTSAIPLQVPTSSPAATSSQAQPTTPPAAIETNASKSADEAHAPHVRITLSNDQSFTLALYPDLAPKTVANFLTKVRSGFYNGLLFFRADKAQDGSTAIVQTGDPTNTGQVGGTTQAEYNKKPFLAGSVGIARGQNRDINSDSQFFIITQDLPNLDGNYTNFGDVIAGLDVVKNIKQGQPIKTIAVIQ